MKWIKSKRYNTPEAMHKIEELYKDLDNQIGKLETGGVENEKIEEKKEEALDTISEIKKFLSEIEIELK